MQFSDETIIAFADGALGEPERSALEQAVRRDPALAAKVARLRPPARPRAKVVQLKTVRAARQLAAAAPLAEQRWAWPMWSALAAALALGLLAGALGLRMLAADDDLLTLEGGLPTARGKLDTALSRQAGNAAAPAVAIGISFLARDGNYCRSFSTGRVSGLACRNQGRWVIPLLVEGGGALAPALRAAIEQRAAGAALDASAERTARLRGWRR